MLVIGCVGFIGSNLVEALVGEYDVAVIDDLSTGELKNLEKEEKKSTFIKKSILDRII